MTVIVVRTLWSSIVGELVVRVKLVAGMQVNETVGVHDDDENDSEEDSTTADSEDGLYPVLCVCACVRACVRHTRQNNVPKVHVMDCPIDKDLYNSIAVIIM